MPCAAPADRPRHDAPAQIGDADDDRERADGGVGVEADDDAGDGEQGAQESQDAVGGQEDFGDHQAKRGGEEEEAEHRRLLADPALTREGLASLMHEFVRAGGKDWGTDPYGVSKAALNALTRIVAVEALECPTMLENGFGEHNIQGIGDKHIPLIHNVMNTDLVVAVSDRATDQLYAMFNSDDGKGYLSDRRGVPRHIIDSLEHFGLSAICNVLAAITTAKMLDLGPDDAIITVATDGAALYPSEYSKITARDFGNGFTNLDAAQVWGEHLANVTTAHGLELTERDKNRIFNLGYYTWVEQQGVSLAEFDARRSQAFWRGLRTRPPADRRSRSNDAPSAARAVRSTALRWPLAN